MIDKEAARVLIIDDETSMRNVLMLAFKIADKFRFEVTDAKSLDECVALERDGKANFDICVIDLGFGPEIELLAGFRVLSGLGCLRGGGLGIVYTGFPTIRNAVKAMRLGAYDFVSKVETPPHELVEHVQLLLQQLAESEDRRRRFQRFIDYEHESLVREFVRGGSPVVIAIADGPDGAPKVIGSGHTRLEALVECSKGTPGVSAANGRLDPYLHTISAGR